jgi:hypothetical protein
MRAAGNAGGGEKLPLPQIHTDETQIFRSEVFLFSPNLK